MGCLGRDAVAEPRLAQLQELLLQGFPDACCTRLVPGTVGTSRVLFVVTASLKRTSQLIRIKDLLIGK
jgi:hypothetical protein